MYKKQVKLFVYKGFMESLEREVNDFLSEFNCEDVLGIKQSNDGKTILVEYREKVDKSR